MFSFCLIKLKHSKKPERTLNVFADGRPSRISIRPSDPKWLTTTQTMAVTRKTSKTSSLELEPREFVEVSVLKINSINKNIPFFDLKIDSIDWFTYFHDSLRLKICMLNEGKNVEMRTRLIHETTIATDALKTSCSSDAKTPPKALRMRTIDVRPKPFWLLVDVVFWLKRPVRFWHKSFRSKYVSTFIGWIADICFGWYDEVINC